MRATTRVLVAVVLVAGGCANDPRRADTPIGEPRRIELPVAATDRVDIRIPAGDVEILGAGGDRLRAELILKCPDASGRCAQRLREVQFVAESGEGRVGLRLNRDRSYRYREGSVSARIEVPRSRQLEVRMTAGNLRIRHVPACIAVDMGAGDVDILAAAATVRRVLLDAGVGDAGLVVNGRPVEAPRSWLVGAELEWTQGSGDCGLLVDLQAGDVEVRLED